MIDLANIGIGLYAAIIYVLNFNHIQTELHDIQLIRLVVPVVACLDILAVLRMSTFIHLFLTIPSLNKNNILNRNKVNGQEFKFPIVTFKEYRKQLKH